jgi:carbon-monoxide dehydrogenase large subunit
MSMLMSLVGKRVQRLEDARLIRGEGLFVDDLDLAHQLEARIVRSQFPHAELVSVDTREARSLPGVVAVLTGEDVRALPRIPMRLKLTGDELDHTLQPPLAYGRVRYVGEPIAVVVAEDSYVAEDAAEKVLVDYERRDPVLDAKAAVDPDAPSLWQESGNEVATIQVGFGDLEASFDSAFRIVSLDLSVGRHSGVPLETRGIVARHMRSRDHIEIWGWTKVTHFNRRVLAEMLGIPVNHIHVHAVDAGGGFGIRGEFYPEDVLIPLLARRLGRPVKWIEDRAEHLVSANHSRNQHHHVAGAFDEEGILLGLRDEVWHDNGGYLRTHGVTVPELTATMLPGPYRVAAYESIVHVITTNKTPCGTYRAPGRYEATFVREQLMSKAAEQLGIDRLELRRRNLLTQEELPHERPLSILGGDMVLSTGDYPALLAATLDASGFNEWEEEAREARHAGRLVGTGVGIFLEKSGLGPYETAEVEVDPSGRVRVLTGGASLGQGIETVLAQIAADELAVDLADVEVIHGETDLIPDGGGSWASRSTVVGGSAVKLAAEGAAAQAKRIGAELLGVTEDKVDLSGGRVVVQNTPDRCVTLGEIASACGTAQAAERGEAPGLGASHIFSVNRMNYPYGVHLAQVEIDPRTGGVQILRYFVGYEIGRAINPQLVEGQLVGGVAQGVGGALMEEFVYDSGGQPLATTFMDYLLPTAAELPRVGTLISEKAPPTDNPLGVMGSGEGGTTGVGAAIANAIDDALGSPGRTSELPVTPSRLYSRLRKGAADPLD